MQSARVLYTCGANDSGQLTTGDDQPRVTPTPVGGWAFARGVRRAGCGKRHQSYVAGSGALYVSGMGAPGTPQRVDFLAADGRFV
jgi:alpha-tubulin suppressor-like RCC1 family protein